MSETRPSRVLDLSGETDCDSVQQYVEVGSNMYIGTKDGIKYTLLQTPDSKLRLVEAPSDSTDSSKASTGSVPSLRNYENQCQVTWSDPEQGSNVIKLLSVKQEPSPCKGQGDEFGNSLVSPPQSILSFDEFGDTKGKINQSETALSLNSSSDLTYVTLLPVQENKKSTDDPYHVTPRRSIYSPTYYPPTAMRPPRCTARRPRMPRPFDPSYSPIPRPRGRGRGSRMRRPRMATYQYTPQILHSTPTNMSSMSYSDTSASLTESASGSQSGTSFDRSISTEYPRVPNNTPTSSDVDSAGNQKVFSLQWMPHITTQVENYVSQDPRETHNEKERKRRLRIKEACQRMKRLIPYTTDKTDNATVFEYAAYFIEFIRKTIGSEEDKEFLQQNYIFQVHQ